MGWAVDYWNTVKMITGNISFCDNKLNDVYMYLNKINDLIPSLLWETRKSLVDDILSQYSMFDFDYGKILCKNYKKLYCYNYNLSELCRNMCLNADELKYLAAKYTELDNYHNRINASKIYYDIGEYNLCIKVLSTTIICDEDYMRMIRCLEQKNRKAAALSYAYSALNRANNKMVMIEDYLFNYHKENNDIAALVNLTKYKQVNKSKIFNYLFNHFKNIGDYESAKKYLLDEYTYAYFYDKRIYYTKFLSYLRADDADRPHILACLIDDMEEYDLDMYLNICMEKNMQVVLCSYLCKNSFGIKRLDKYAEFLQKDFPDEMTEYYIKSGIYISDCGKNRESYNKAMYFFKKAKYICIKISKSQTKWADILNKLRVKYRHNTSFIDESRVLQ